MLRQAQNALLGRAADEASVASGRRPRVFGGDGPPPWPWRSGLTALVAAGVGALGVGLAAAPAAHATIAGWGFEQVTPANKGEGTVATVRGFRAAPDGNSLVHVAKSPYAGAPAESSPLLVRYLALRGPEGWSNRGIDPPENARDSLFYGTLQTSQDGSHAIVGSTRALTPGAIEGGGNLYMRNTHTGALQLIAARSDPAFSESGGTSSYQGPTFYAFAANDGRSALFTEQQGFQGPGQPVSTPLLRWTAGRGTEVVSVLPDDEGGLPAPTGATVGTEPEGTRDPMPQDDGHALDRIYFVAEYQGVQGAYVRENGATKRVSYSRIPGASPRAVPVKLGGASAGGRYLAFVTTGNTPLTESTPVSSSSSTRYVYRYDATDESLQYVGAYEHGFYLDIWQMAQDGKTIVFRSGLDLPIQRKPGGPQPVDGVTTMSGDNNLYVWKDDGTARGRLQLAAPLEADPDAAAGSGMLRLLSPSGRYFSFSTMATPLAARFGLDNVTPDCPPPNTVNVAGPCDQVYRYDVQEDELECVSCRKDGLRPRGPAGEPHVLDASSGGAIEVDHHQIRTVTDDGTVFFSTADDLVPEDSNGETDAYAYMDGRVQLLSRGSAGTRSRFLEASPDGKTVFFTTDDPIVATDRDSQADIYMTRLGAGYPDPASPGEPCVGSDCRVAGVAAPVPPMIGSVSFVDSGNVLSVEPALPGRVSAQRPKAIRGHVARVSVKVPSAGRISVSGSQLVAFHRTVSRAGTYTVKVQLTLAGRRAQKRRTVKSTARIAFRPRTGSPAKATVVTTFKRAAKSASATKTKGGK